MGNDLQRIEALLVEIKDMLKKLPEIQAAVYLQMAEEAAEARLRGQKTTDIWTIAPPTER